MPIAGNADVFAAKVSAVMAITVPATVALMRFGKMANALGYHMRNRILNPDVISSAIVTVTMAMN